MNKIWNAQEKALVASRTGGSIIGSKLTVKRKLEEFLDASKADEIMVNAMIFDQEKRLRSYEIISEIFSEKISDGEGRLTTNKHEKEHEKEKNI